MKIKKVLSSAIAAVTLLSSASAFAVPRYYFDSGISKGISYYNKGMYYEARDEFQWFADYNWEYLNSGQQKYLLDYLGSAKAKIREYEKNFKYSSDKKSYFYQCAKEAEEYEDEMCSISYGINLNLNNAYQKWDALLNEVYQYLKSTKDSSTFASIEKDEIRWIKEKENAINTWADNYIAVYGYGTIVTGHSLSVGISYTKERVYYLISLI